MAGRIIGGAVYDLPCPFKLDPDKRADDPGESWVTFFILQNGKEGP